MALTTSQETRKLLQLQSWIWHQGVFASLASAWWWQVALVPKSEFSPIRASSYCQRKNAHTKIFQLFYQTSAGNLSLLYWEKTDQKINQLSLLQVVNRLDASCLARNFIQKLGRCDAWFWCIDIGHWVTNESSHDGYKANKTGRVEDLARALFQGNLLAWARI